MLTRRIADLEVSAIGLGEMPLSIQGRPSWEDGKRVVRRAVELGVDFIDTADVYCLDEGDVVRMHRCPPPRACAAGASGPA